MSSRHLSFLETGRSKPSREMVVHLAGVLDLPLRDSNLLLNSAGFAPMYSQFDLDAPEMEGVRAVLATILEAHLPNPAAVVDRLGNLVDANVAAFHLMGALVAPESEATLPTPNLNRLTFHPDGIKDRLLNWPDVAVALLVRLQREAEHRPADTELSALVEEMTAYPGVAELGSGHQAPTGADLLIPMRADVGTEQPLSLITTISTVGSPYDVTLDELRLETFFPADNHSREILSGWASSE